MNEWGNAWELKYKEDAVRSMRGTLRRQDTPILCGSHCSSSSFLIITVDHTTFFPPSFLYFFNQIDILVGRRYDNIIRRERK